MVPLGIRPTNDFAFLLTFGSPENKIALISLLNAILKLPCPVTDVQIENPFNYREFLDDKLSILDILATDTRGWVFNIEMQVSAVAELMQRLTYYACDQYADQLRSGNDYNLLRPVFTICLVEQKIWTRGSKVHHAFRLTDSESGRTLENGVEIHTLELGWYNLVERDLATASDLERWLFWLLHAEEYDTETLRKLFPEPPIVQATATIDRIARVTEDKIMYDAREKRLRDQRWLVNASVRQGLEDGRNEGRIEGHREGHREGFNLGSLLGVIKSFQRLLGLAQSSDEELMTKDPAELSAMASELESQIQRKLQH
ncbi:MAG: Rpn family recombination-promoting nuclease/putative transposase [Pirellula sp.]